MADELNVDEIDAGDELGDVLTFELVPNFKTLGPRLGKRSRSCKAALAALDGASAGANLEAGRPLTIALGAESVVLTPDDVSSCGCRGQQGYAVSREGGEVVALDLALYPRAARARVWCVRSCGWSRTCARAPGSKWRTVSCCTWRASRSWPDYFDAIAREVLAVSIVPGPGEGAGTVLDSTTSSSGVR